MEYDHCEQNDFNDETSITIEEAMFEYEMTEMFVQEMDDSITRGFASSDKQNLG